MTFSKLLTSSITLMKVIMPTFGGLEMMFMEYLKNIWYIGFQEAEELF